MPGRTPTVSTLPLYRCPQTLCSLREAIPEPLSLAANVAYPTILTFLRDQPNNAILTRNAPTLGFRSTEGAWYVQDDMKLRSNFSLRLGLRHEMTNGWNE